MLVGESGRGKSTLAASFLAYLAGGYDRANLTAFVDRSLRNLETEALDLLRAMFSADPGQRFGASP